MNNIGLFFAGVCLSFILPIGVQGFGVASSCWIDTGDGDHSLGLRPGESVVSTHWQIQNCPPDDPDVEVHVSLTQGLEVASLVGTNPVSLVYLVTNGACPSSSSDVSVPVKISIPTNATVGYRYVIGAEFRVCIPGEFFCTAVGTRCPVEVVGPPNRSPIATEDNYSACINMPLFVEFAGLLANDTDADGNNLVAVLVSPPSFGELVLDPQGSFRYTPSSNYIGRDSFTYVATDGVLTSAVTTASISVGPIAWPTDKTVECGTPWTFDSPNAVEVCGATNVTMSIVSTVTNSVCGNTFSATRTWAATDASSNIFVSAQTVAVVDRTPPAISCPSNFTIAVTSLGGTVVRFAVAANDTCDPSPIVICTPASGSTFMPGVTTVNCTASDACRNSESCKFDITIQEDEKDRDGLLARWRFDEGTDRVVHDESGNRIDGQISGTATWTQGIFGGALEFGKDGLVNLGDHPLLDGIIPCTVSLWIYPTLPLNATNSGIFYAKRAGQKGLALVHSTHLELHHDSSHAIERLTNFAANAWYHLAATLTSTKASLYVNGTEIGTELGSFTITANDLVAQIGGGFDGRIDDVRIYDRALSPAEIARLTGKWLPRLIIAQQGTNVILNWWTNAVDFALETTMNFSLPVAWTPVSSPAYVVNAQNTVTQSATDQSRFYRLRRALQPDSNTVALYHFDQPSGDALDSSANGWLGTLSNGAARAVSAAGLGTALALDGADDHVAISADLLNNRPQGTFEATIYQEAHGGAIVSKGQEGPSTSFLVGTRDDGRLGVHMGTALNFYGNTAIPTNTWTRIAVTWDGQAWKLYINGRLDAETAISDVPIPNSRLVQIGKHDNGPLFRGRIDEVRFSSIARSFP